MKLQYLIEAGRRAFDADRDNLPDPDLSPGERPQFLPGDSEVSSIQYEDIKGAPKDVNRYYRECRKEQKGKSKEYCARVAWQRYCMYKNPSYSGCTQYGKTKGEPYSAPIKDHVEDCGCGG